MNKQRVMLLTLIGCLGLMLLITMPAFARPPESALRQAAPEVTTLSPLATPPARSTAVPLELSQPGTIELPFAILDQSTFNLRSPADQESFQFQLPFRWQARPEDSFLEVHYDTVLQAVAPDQIPAVNVLVNGAFASTFVPQIGPNHSVRVPLPAGAFKDAQDLAKDIRFVLYDGRDCSSVDRVQVTVHDDSFLHLEYESLEGPLALADYPQLLEQGIYLPETIYIIIPDAYDDNDLAAVGSVAAAIGETARHETTVVSVVQASQANSTMLQRSSAVAIGRPGRNAFIANLYQENLLPTASSTTGGLVTGSGEPIAPDHGVLQIIPSTYSPEHVFLLVTGSTDEAVTKAAQALSSRNGRFALDRPLALIEGIGPAVESRRIIAEKRTLAELGFRDSTLTGLGIREISASFFVPGNWQILESPTLDLSMVHAAGLVPFASGVTIELNDRPIASIPIQPGDEVDRNVEIALPVADFRPGETNRLSFRTNADIAQECLPRDTDLAWIRIRNSSEIDIPHIVRAVTEPELDLDKPFNSLATEPDLGDVWFVLSNNPTPAEITGMARFAYTVGDLSAGPGFRPRVTRGVGGITELTDFHVVIIGRSSTNQLIPIVNNDLLQPFLPGTDDLQQVIGNVLYQLPTEFGIGVVQLQPSPWNSNKTLLLVSGTTQQGVEWALDAFYAIEPAPGLDGDLAFVRPDHIETLKSSDLVAGAMPIAISSIISETQAADGTLVNVEQNGGLPDIYQPLGTERPAGVSALAILLAVVGVGTAATGIWWQRRRRDSILTD